MGLRTVLAGGKHHGAKAARAYRYLAGGFGSQSQPQHVDTVFQFSNSKQAGAAMALPAGTVRLYMRDKAGEPKFLGENQIGHTPQGSEVVIKTGEAFDVTVQSTVVATEKLSNSRTRTSMSYLFRNAKPTPATVDFRQAAWGRDVKVSKESLAGQRVDAGTFGWAVPVPAEGQTVLTFTIDTGW